MDAAKILVYTDNKIPLAGVLGPHAASTTEFPVAIKKHNGKSTATFTHKETRVITFAARCNIFMLVTGFRAVRLLFTQQILLGGTVAPKRRPFSVN